MDRPGTNSASDAPDPVAALYARDPDEFVAARTALVSAARQAGDKELAKRLGMLKRPTRSAWLVNLLHHADPGVAARLADLAHRLGAAHASVDVAAIRTLGRERATLVDDLTARALVLGEAAGYAGGEAVRAEVAGTYAAALADPAALDDVTSGRLERARTYAGFGFPLGLPDPAMPAPVAAGATAAPTPALSDGTDERRRAATERVERAAAVLADAQEALAGAEAAEESARGRLDRASQEVADLRAELRAAEAAETQARAAATAVADELHDAAAVLQQAESAHQQAQRDLAALDRG